MLTEAHWSGGQYAQQSAAKDRRIAAQQSELADARAAQRHHHERGPVSDVAGRWQTDPVLTQVAMLLAGRAAREKRRADANAALAHQLRQEQLAAEGIPNADAGRRPLRTVGGEAA